MFEVALGEVVNPSMEGGDGDGVAGAGSPDFGVDGDELQGRRRRVGVRETLRIGRHGDWDLEIGGRRGMESLSFSLFLLQVLLGFQWPPFQDS